jgi:hypothetical protein
MFRKSVISSTFLGILTLRVFCKSLPRSRLKVLLEDFPFDPAFYTGTSCPSILDFSRLGCESGWASFSFRVDPSFKFCFSTLFS